MTREQKINIIGTSIFTMLLIVMISFTIRVWPVIKTGNIVSQQAISCKQNDTKSGVLETKDRWDNNLVCTRIAEETVVIYEVRSSGRDKEFGTDDDITATKIDLNKSKILGRWIGKKTKEAAVGLIDGLKEESKFKGTEEKSVEFKSKAKGLWDLIPEEKNNKLWKNYEILCTLWNN